MSSDNADKEWADELARITMTLQTGRMVVAMEIFRAEIDRRRKLLDKVAPR